MLLFSLSYIIEVDNEEKQRACKDGFYTGKVFCLLMYTLDWF